MNEDDIMEKAERLEIDYPCEQDINHWVSSKYLPADGESVLVTIDDGVYPIEISIGMRVDDKWYIGDTAQYPILEEYVIAWMRLPEPFKPIDGRATHG